MLTNLKEINQLEEIQEKHRAWLKLHEGLKYGRGVEGHYKKGEEWTKTKYKDSHFDSEINLIGRLPNQTRIEFDGDEKEAKKFLEETENKLKQYGWGYIRSTHNGKCDYLWVEFTRDIKDKEAKSFLEWIAPKGSIIDENFASSEKIFPCLFAVHWKHSYQRELPLYFVEGKKIDFDSLNIVKQKGKNNIEYSEKFDYETFQKASKVFNNRMNEAEQFYKQQPIYYDDSGLFWIWNNSSKAWFRIKRDEDIANKIQEILGVDTIDSKIRNEIFQALKQIGRKYKPQEFKKTWIQFKNGIIDIESPSILIEATPQYFTVNPIPWNIGNSDSTPVMDKIFEQWVGRDYVKTLYQILAYSLLSDYPIHRLFCFIGEGLNGKSKFLNLLKNFVGCNNVTSTELDVLLSSRFEVTRLHKKLVCMMGETNFNEMNKTSILKKLTGQDLIGFEYKNKDPFEDINSAKILISTNNLPTTTDKTIGFYRRWLIIDFPNRFSEKKDILNDIPEIEYENLAYKSINILSELLKNKEFYNEGNIEQRMKRYEDHSDPLEKFIKEFTTEDYNGKIWKFDFEKKLNQWCQENRFRQMSEVAIGKKMKEKGIQQNQMTSDWLIDGVHKLLRAWTGISWKSSVNISSQDSQDKQVIPTQFTRIGNELDLLVNPVNPVNPVIRSKEYSPAHGSAQDLTAQKPELANGLIQDSPTTYGGESKAE